MASDEITSRSEPFLRAKWVMDSLPFDPIQNSTFCEFEKSEQLYELIGAYIVKHTDHSYKFTTKPNQSKATRILENLARIAKHNKETRLLSDDEVKQFDTEEKLKEDEMKSKVITSLGLGLHTFDFENNKYYAIHQIIGSPVGGGMYCTDPLIYKSLIIFVEGRNNLQLLKHFVNYIVETNQSQKDSLFVKIYRFSIKCNYWRLSCKKIARDHESIILPTKTWSKLINDFERFLDEKSIKWYFKHGIPYKRSYLFYGVPGSGKSSLIEALAKKYDRNVAFLQPIHCDMTDENFKKCIQSAPENSLIVLEDIDALFNKDRSTKHRNCPLTFSGLLNGLDGVGNPNGQIFIMTTNFVGRLDNALIRSGRVDLHIEFPLATDEQLNKIFLLFYPQAKNLSQQFCDEIRKHFPDGISMAAVQQHFIQNMFIEEKIVIDRVKELGYRLDVVGKFDEDKKDISMYHQLQYQYIQPPMHMPYAYNQPPMHMPYRYSQPPVPMPNTYQPPVPKSFIQFMQNQNNMKQYSRPMQNTQPKIQNIKPHLPGKIDIQLQGELQGHNDWITCIKVDYNNPNKIISSSRDKTIIIWDLKTKTINKKTITNGNMLKTLKGHNHIVSNIDISNDSNYILSSSWDGLLRLWNIKTGRCIKRFVGHQKDILSVQFSGDNRKIISCGRDKNILLWNNMGAIKQQINNAHNDWISCITFSPNIEDNDKFVTASYDKLVKVWINNDDGLYKLKHELRQHKTCITSLAISPDGSLCATGDKYGILCLWDINDGILLSTINASNTELQINYIVFSPNGYWVCFAIGNAIKIWDLETKSLFQGGINSRKITNICNCIQWSYDGKTLYAGYSDNKIRIWKLISAFDGINGSNYVINVDDECKRNDN